MVFRSFCNGMNICNRAASVRPSVHPSVCRHFVKFASCTRQIGGSRPNLHTMVPWWACIQGVLKIKVEVKGHEIRELLWCHENRFFSRANGWIATKLAHDGPQTGLHSGYAQGHGRDRMSRDTATFVMSWKSLLLVDKRLDHHQTRTAWSPDGPASRMCTRSTSRSKVTWYSHLCDINKIASSRGQMARSPPNLHTMVPSLACIPLLHSPSWIRIRQLDATSKSGNELLRHWWSGVIFAPQKLVCMKKRFARLGLQPHSPLGSYAYAVNCIITSSSNNYHYYRPCGMNFDYIVYFVQ